MLSYLNPVQSRDLGKIALEPPADVNRKSNDELENKDTSLKQKYSWDVQNRDNPNRGKGLSKSTVMSNTVPECQSGVKSEPKATHPLEYPHEKIIGNDHQFFVHDLTFFRDKVTGLSERHVENMKLWFLEGWFFPVSKRGECDSFEYWEKDFPPRVLPNNGKRYDYHWVNSIGVELLVKYYDEFCDRVESISLKFRGETLEALYPRNNFLPVVGLIESVDMLGLKMTRIDLTHSMPLDALDINQIRDSALNWDFSGAKCRKVIDDGERDNPDAQGLTVYIGSAGKKGKRRSDKLYRWYLEMAVHGVNRLRAEMECHDKHALLAVKELLARYNDPSLDNKAKNISMIQWVKDYMYSYKNVNFVESASIKAEKYAKNYKRLPWWQSFLDGLSVTTYKPVFAKVKSTLQSTFDWFYKSATPTERALDHVYGREFVHKLLDARLDAKAKDRCGQFSDSEIKKIREIEKLGTMGMSKMFSPELLDKLVKQGLTAISTKIKSFGQINAVHHRELNRYPEYYQSPLPL